MTRCLHAIAELPVPEIRLRLAADGYPSDLKTALLVRAAARQGALFWTKERLRIEGKSRLNLKPEHQDD